MARKRTKPLKIEPSGSNDYGPCECCGNMSRCVWGSVHSPKKVVAAYFVHWTLTRVADHGASFDLIIGKWGERASAADRSVVSLMYRLEETGPSFMVIDAADRPAATGGMADHALRRSDVIGKPIAQTAFAIVDAILTQDERVAEVLGPWHMT
jgi:hypothetical protein